MVPPASQVLVYVIVMTLLFCRPEGQLANYDSLLKDVSHVEVRAVPLLDSKLPQRSPTPMSAGSRFLQFSGKVTKTQFKGKLEYLGTDECVSFKEETGSNQCALSAI